MTQNKRKIRVERSFSCLIINELGGKKHLK